MSKKIYVSGKITGLLYEEALYNFKEAEKKLLKKGFEVVNPMTLDHSHDLSWEAYMKVDIKALMECNHIYMLNGWRDSRGAVIEYTLAKDLNYIILHENED